MRFFELLIAIILGLTLTGWFHPRFRSGRVLSLLPLSAMLIIPIHLVLEGYRWQMVPLYLLAGGWGLAGVIRLARHPDSSLWIRNRVLRIAGRTFLILIFTGSVVFPALLPVRDLPPPEGPYPVGRIKTELSDVNREEIFTLDTSDYRRVMLTIWYPAEKASDIRRDRYWDRKGYTGKAYTENAGMGRFWYTHLKNVRTNSRTGIPVSREGAPFPLLIYSHSFYGLPSENTMLAEEMASRGYVVTAINHTYESIVAIFGDTGPVTGNLEHIDKLYDSRAEQEKRLYGELRNATGKEEKILFIRQILQVDDLSTRLLRIRTRDVLSVLDEMERLNDSDGLFHGRLDTERVGVMGWSFGGATAMEACLADGRLKACVNIDGLPYGMLFNTGERIEQPFTMIRSDSDDEMEEIAGDLIMEQAVGPANLFQIENATHLNFWDFPLFFPVYQHIGFWGTIEPEQLLELEKQYIGDFFDRYLKGETIRNNSRQ